jgi:hypothetical protein
LVIKRMSEREESDLLDELSRAPELAFDRSARKDEVERMKVAARAFSKEERECHAATFAYLDSRPDLEGLPFLRGSACRLDARAARALEKASAVIHAGAWSGKGEIWRRPESLPALRQITMGQMGQMAVHREELMSRLAAHEGAAGAAALARHAVFDTSPNVRAKALEELRRRPEADYLPTLLEGFRHPWPAAAEHAAEAIATLAPRSALPALVALLDAPEPRFAPEKPGRPTTVREVVRVNHMDNCLLCHAPSTSPADAPRARVPLPGDSPFAPQPRGGRSPA